MSWCYECNVMLVSAAKPGRRVRYRGQDGYTIPADLVLPTCPRCGDFSVTHDQAFAIDKAYEEQWVRGVV